MISFFLDGCKPSIAGFGPIAYLPGRQKWENTDKQHDWRLPAQPWLTRQHQEQPEGQRHRLVIGDRAHERRRGKAKSSSKKYPQAAPAQELSEPLDCQQDESGEERLRQWKNRMDDR